jgi:hypothetical protein
MNTVTICEASIRAHYQFHDACVAIAGGNLSADDFRRVVVRANRLQRQCRTFDAALHMSVQQLERLKHMIHVQVQIIHRKNAEIDALQTKLSRCLIDAQIDRAGDLLHNGDYAGDIVNDSESGLISEADIS